MKKLFALAMTLVMAVTLFTACGSSKDEATTAKKEEVATVDTTGVKTLQKGKLNVGIEIGYPPFEVFAEDGKTEEGYDIDIISGVAKRLGLEVNFVNTAFDGIFNGIDKNYDVVCSCITITKERQKTMLFSDPYMDNYQSVVVKKDSKAKISSFNDLDGLTVGLQDGTTSKEIMDDLIGTKTLKKCKYIPNEKVENCFKQLNNGEVDAVLVDSIVAVNQIKADKGLKVAWNDTEQPEKIGIAMGKENTELQKKINKALKEMEADGFIKELYARWFPGVK